jgi:hypothetical protein
VNAGQVNQEWWRSVEARRAQDRAELERRREASGRAQRWCRLAFPELVDDRGCVCPWLVMAAVYVHRRGEKVDRGSVLAERDRHLPRFAQEFWMERGVMVGGCRPDRSRRRVVDALRPDGDAA